MSDLSPFSLFINMQLLQMQIKVSRCGVGCSSTNNSVTIFHVVLCSAWQLWLCSTFTLHHQQKRGNSTVRKSIYKLQG